MKKIILIAMTVLFTNGLFALTLDTNARFDTARDYTKGPVSAHGTFGKIPIPGDYGIFLAVKYQAGKDNDGHESLFFRLDNEMVKEGKYLYAMVEGEKVLLAKKKWYGYKTANDVKIKYSMKKTPYPTFKVWVEIE